MKRMDNIIEVTIDYPHKSQSDAFFNHGPSSIPSLILVLVLVDTY